MGQLLESLAASGAGAAAAADAAAAAAPTNLALPPPPLLPALLPCLQARAQAQAADPHAAAGAVEAEKSSLKAILGKYNVSDADLLGAPRCSNSSRGALPPAGCCWRWRRCCCCRDVDGMEGCGSDVKAAGRVLLGRCHAATVAMSLPPAHTLLQR